MQTAPLRLDHFSTTGLAAWLAAHPRGAAVLWPIGSVEPHGPHLPLATDTILATRNAEQAARALRAEGIATVVAPPLPYGVTDFAAGFPGAVSLPIDTLVSILVAGTTAFLRDGFAHVCWINHHLEPGQLAAIAKAKAQAVDLFGEAAVSAPQVVSRRWGRKLTDEFKSGACHAGCYETSLVLAEIPDLVDMRAARALPEVPISLSVAIADGAETFLAAGADAAYTGAPEHATATEGESTYAVFSEMVVTEVREHLAAGRAAAAQPAPQISSEKDPA
ncbi:MAG: creatinine amidohydrolase [Bradymonadia bacterium]|jgi:creatinine amidohydrolase